MKMKNKNILITFIVLATIVTSCMNEEIEGFTNQKDASTESSSVITLTTDRVDGILSLSIDVPENKHTQVWIDLNGDGVRAEDGSEDITLFNSYQDYSVQSGLKTISIYGDITYLAGASNDLTGIDISRNPYLTTLNVPLNKLSALDVSKNNALTHLDFSDNNIHTLDVSQNKELISLWCFNNNLTQLDISNNTNLAFIDCSGNQLNSLDISQNSELVRLIAFNNQLAALDISQNNKLKRLWLFGNSLSYSETERIENIVNAMSNVDLWITDFDTVSKSVSEPIKKT
jgi:hypothetical protein